ncbi:(11Z)-hexadec-11-enoyl-CoA conjugase, partial [Blattella germanica]
MTSSQGIDGRSKSSAVQEIVWGNVVRFSYAHMAAIYGLYRIIVEGRYDAALFAFVYGTCGLIGITAGAHRLWSHRAYRAKWQLRLTLAVFETMAFQNSIFDWARDHRVHHKFTETDADPHNAKRGFFFSHMGWLLMKKHPHIRERGKAVDLSDLRNDPIVMWQKKYYLLLMPVLAFVVPTWAQMHFFGCGFWTSWHISMLRWILSLHMTWLVNSAAHLWGRRPY